jgi:hypothetical protein
MTENKNLDDDVRDELANKPPSSNKEKWIVAGAAVAGLAVLLGGDSAENVYRTLSEHPIQTVGATVLGAIGVGLLYNKIRGYK